MEIDRLIPTCLVCGAVNVGGKCADPECHSHCAARIADLERRLAEALAGGSDEWLTERTGMYVRIEQLEAKLAEAEERAEQHYQESCELAVMKGNERQRAEAAERERDTLRHQLAEARATVEAQKTEVFDAEAALKRVADEAGEAVGTDPELRTAEGCVAALIIHRDQLKEYLDEARAEVGRLREWAATMERERDHAEDVEVPDVQSRLDRALALLREVEWAYPTPAVVTYGIECPVCHMAREEGHAPDCRLAALLEEHDA